LEVLREGKRQKAEGKKAGETRQLPQAMLWFGAAVL
jgi:hypothetical protein